MGEMPVTNLWCQQTTPIAWVTVDHKPLKALALTQRALVGAAPLLPHSRLAQLAEQATFRHSPTVLLQWQAMEQLQSSNITTLTVTSTRIQSQRTITTVSHLTHSIPRCSMQAGQATTSIQPQTTDYHKSPMVFTLFEHAPEHAYLKN